MSNARTLAGLIDGSNIVVPSGYGLDFSSSSDSTATGVTVQQEVLSDYEEGIWTPILGSVIGGTLEYTPTSNNVGRYVKIGKKVFATATVSWSGSNSGTFSGYLGIKGLPFPSEDVNDLRYAGTLGGTTGITMPTGYTNGFALPMDKTLSYVYIIARSTSGYTHSPTVSTSGAIYGVSITYFTD